MKPATFVWSRCLLLLHAVATLSGAMTCAMAWLPVPLHVATRGETVIYLGLTMIFGGIGFVTGLLAMALRKGKSESLLLGASTLIAFLLLLLAPPLFFYVEPRNVLGQGGWG